MRHLWDGVAAQRGRTRGGASIVPLRRCRSEARSLRQALALVLRPLRVLLAPQPHREAPLRLCFHLRKPASSDTNCTTDTTWSGLGCMRAPEATAGTLFTGKSAPQKMA